MKRIGFVFLCAMTFGLAAHADLSATAKADAAAKDLNVGPVIDDALATAIATDNPDLLDADEFDPTAPDAERRLEEFDLRYQEITGLSPFLPGSRELMTPILGGCYRDSCQIWAHVSRAEQRLYLYINGVH